MSIRSYLAALLILLWGIEAVQIFWPDPWLRSAAGMIAVVFFVVAVPVARAGMRLLCLVLTAAAAGLAWVVSWEMVPGALESATVFAPFLVTIVMLRAAADLRPEIGRAQALFAGMPDSQRKGGFQAGSFLVGSILNIGVLALVAPIATKDADAPTRRAAAEAVLRGLCLSPYWSPFWVAMAVAYGQLPMVPLWQVIGLGLGMAVLGFLLAHVMFNRALGIGSLIGALAGFAPLIPPVALCAALVAGLTSFTSLGTVKSLMIVVPVLCALVLVLAWCGAGPGTGPRGGRGVGRTAVTSFRRGLEGVTGEVALLIIAMTLGRLMGLALDQAGDGVLAVTAGIGAPALIAIFLFGGVAASLVGAHAVVIATVVLAIGVSLPDVLAPLVLMQTMLIAWGTSALIGVASVTLALSSGLFAVPRDKLMFGPNLRYALIYTILATLVLSALNAWLMD